MNFIVLFYASAENRFYNNKKQTNTMNKLFKFLAALFAASSIAFAGLGVSGFVDASWDDESSSLDIDEVELRLALDTEGTVSGAADLSYTPNATNEIDLEQVYLTYDLGNGASLTIGQFESTLGFDAYDADGLIANSGGLDLGLGYDSGIRYSSGALNVSLVEESGQIGGDAYSLEASYGLNLGEGLNAFVGLRTDDASGNDLTNAYVTYETGALTLIAEMYEGEGADEGTQIAAVYSYSDSSAITLRSAEDDGVDSTTIAHATQLADDLALIIDVTESDNDDTNTVVELLYTF